MWEEVYNFYRHQNRKKKMKFVVSTLSCLKLYKKKKWQGSIDTFLDNLSQT